MTLTRDEVKKILLIDQIELLPNRGTSKMTSTDLCEKLKLDLRVELSLRNTTAGQ